MGPDDALHNGQTSTCASAVRIYLVKQVEDLVVMPRVYSCSIIPDVKDRLLAVPSEADLHLWGSPATSILQAVVDEVDQSFN